MKLLLSGFHLNDHTLVSLERGGITFYDIIKITLASRVTFPLKAVIILIQFPVTDIYRSHDFPFAT